ncbi:aminoglycoside 6-adenylyltransferase [Phenylobacterium sp.]|uniref:aminoglycoside 6-adenylyltransferase n=1 Tax=Phenylobacterium sp. TaxID=1871053 RepID=UPI0035B2EFF5
MAQRDELIDAVATRAQGDERVRALFLGGSLGRGEGDDFSDVDLIAVVGADDHKAFVAEALPWVEAAVEIVNWKAPHPPLPLFTAITADWARLDLTVTVPGVVSGARDELKPLIDRDGVHEALRPRRREGGPDPQRLDVLVREFLRVLGLLSVVVGRGEVAVSVTGAGLQRQAIISLLVEEQGLPTPPGALSLSRVLPPDDLELATGLPLAAADMDSVIDTHLAYARIFLPRARALAERIGAPWPDAFEAATRAHLKRAIGRDWGCA